VKAFRIPEPRLVAALGMLLVLTALGTLGYRWIEDMTSSRRSS